MEIATGGDRLPDWRRHFNFGGMVSELLVDGGDLLNACPIELQTLDRT